LFITNLPITKDQTKYNRVVVVVVVVVGLLYWREREREYEATVL